jgi:hypothetical protein
VKGSRLVQRIRQLMELDWEVKLSNVYCEAIFLKLLSFVNIHC